MEKPKKCFVQVKMFFLNSIAATHFHISHYLPYVEIYSMFYNFRNIFILISRLFSYYILLGFLYRINEY